ncbi:MAG TPA: toll/interleukin-1 receptor domain-containing protein [Bryobacteraceae bacterium]|jgi:hypothetical protein|nr:toll/interleukin-1 receptor domain-containing protein [Bryobacteraceae bacterium]
MTLEELSRLIQRLLRRSKQVEVNGLGIFARKDTGEISFEHSNRLRVFIAYATEDRAIAERLFRQLTARGFAAWLDRRKLLPGQDWPHRIEDAIESSDFLIACFSSRSIRKRGGFQREIRLALECASRIPLDDVFLIPVRLDDCRIPTRIRRETQYVDLFPDWRAGFERVLRIIENQVRRAA